MSIAELYVTVQECDATMLKQSSDAGNKNINPDLNKPFNF